jgi:cell division protein FtsN
MQASIRQTMERIRKIETSLLEQGITPEFTPVVSAPASTTTKPVKATPYPLYFRPTTAFPAKHILPPPKPEQPEMDEKYIFKVGKTSQVFLNPPVTAGLIYRIQIGSFSRKLPQKDLKGLSPVFIQQDKKLFIHSAGQFTTYKEAEKVLPLVKKQGFRDAMIVALIDGKKTPKKTALEYEAKQKAKPQLQTQLQPETQVFPVSPPPPQTVTAPAKEKESAPANADKAVYNVVLGEFPDKLPQALRQAVQQHTHKDIIKSSAKGNAVYSVGPFTTLVDAEKLQAQLKANGFEVTIE